MEFLLNTSFLFCFDGRFDLIPVDAASMSSLLLWCLIFKHFFNFGNPICFIVRWFKNFFGLGLNEWLFRNLILRYYVFDVVWLIRSNVCLNIECLLLCWRKTKSDHRLGQLILKRVHYCMINQWFSEILLSF